MCCVRNPRNINVFVRAPGREESGSRPGGSVTGVTEKLFMCQMFMCLFRPLPLGENTFWTIPILGFWSLNKISSQLCGAKLQRVLTLGDGLSGPVLRDTARLSQRYPPIARYGAFGVSTWPIGCDTPSPFSERFPHEEHAKWRCDTPPLKGVSQRYWRDTLWKQGKWVLYPPLRYYLERVLRDMGGYLALGR